MAKTQKPVPVGLRKPSKGAHSEHNTQRRAPWFGLNLNPPICPTDNNGKERKMPAPFIPPCVPAE